MGSQSHISPSMHCLCLWQYRLFRKGTCRSPFSKPNKFSSTKHNTTKFQTANLKSETSLVSGSRYRPISSVTSHHVTLRTGGQASVCLQHGGESDYEAWVVTRLFWKSTTERIKGKVSRKVKVYRRTRSGIRAPNSWKNPFTISITYLKINSIQRSLVLDEKCTKRFIFHNLEESEKFHDQHVSKRSLMCSKSLCLCFLPRRLCASASWFSTSPTLSISTKWNNTEPSVAFLGTLINLLAGTAQQVFEWWGAIFGSVTLLNYFLFNLFLFLQKVVGGGGP